MRNKIYVLERLGTSWGSGSVSALVYPEDGPPYPLGHVVLHSPTGFAWGYAGSGPADLALSLLADALDEVDLTPQDLREGRSRAWLHHQRLKHAVVAPQTADRWSITARELSDFALADEEVCDVCQGARAQREEPCSGCAGLGVIRKR